MGGGNVCKFKVGDFVFYRCVEEGHETPHYVIRRMEDSMLKNLSLAVCVGALLVGTAYADTAPQETVEITFNGSVIDAGTCTFSVNDITSESANRTIDLGAVYAAPSAKGPIKPLTFALTGCGTAEGLITWQAGTNSTVETGTHLLKGNNSTATKTYVGLFTTSSAVSNSEWLVGVPRSLTNDSSIAGAAQLINDSIGPIPAGNVEAIVDFVIEYH